MSMSALWELTTVIKCVTTPLALTIAAVMLASIFSTIHTSAQVNTQYHYRYKNMFCLFLQMLTNALMVHCTCALSTVTTLLVVISVTAMLAMSCRMMVSLAQVSK